MKPNSGLWRDAFKRLAKNKLAVSGAVIIFFLVLVAIMAPLIAPRHYSEADFAAVYSPPGALYPLGADFLGRDLLSRLIYGTRISLQVGVLGALSAFSIGILYGTISGYFGGNLDNVMMRIVDILYAFPDLLFVILLMVTFKSGYGGEEAAKNPLVLGLVAIDKQLGGMMFILIGISVTSWVGMARMSRGMALSLREREFVQAAKAQGAHDFTIMARHLMPNLVGPLLVSVTLAVPGYIGTEAFLSFIGLGVDPPTPSWGAMVADGYQAMRSYPHLAIFPGLALAIVMLSFNFLGDGLRDALDPKIKQ